MLHKHLLNRLCKARVLLRQADADSLSVPEVARSVGLSTFHFIRLYKSVFGETPNQCQIRARIDKAKDWLLTTDISVTRICMDTGCSSTGSFTTQFKQQVGLSPRAFRYRYRSQRKVRPTLPDSLIPGCFSLMPGKMK
ncbi:helix-turn-helix domain-containing protein [Saccharospirillum salsuginis]|uniref:HTH araC/xylS-type domain-containing protein n=1 Tax=Saccharospirillum salsuginis TaxID=418750 RepID=A0A918K269_9GAMM|nr:hypothetical protein GCM10007392_06570 [Saccharospirillum salsuginis]